MSETKIDDTILQAPKEGRGVHVTERAALEIGRVIEENGLPAEGTWVRIGAKGGGCSGFSYVLDFDQAGPTYVIKRVTDGNLIAQDHLEVEMEALASSDFTNWKNEADVSAAIIETSGAPQKNVALPNFTFFMEDSAGNALTGLTITAQRSLDSATFGATDNSATEVAFGVYDIDLTAADMNGDNVTLRFTAAGARDRVISIITQA